MSTDRFSRGVGALTAQAADLTRRMAVDLMRVTSALCRG